MLSPEIGNAPVFDIPWGADNGCFAHPERFDLDRYFRWLQKQPAATCLFATAPDVVADAQATWERSKDVLPMLRELGCPAALVAQDGIENMTIEWDAFDVIFIGGSTAWKLSEFPLALIAEARVREKWVHVGRVNSLIRLRHFTNAGVDSVDGTFVAFGPDKNLRRLESWFQEIESKPSLFEQLNLAAGSSQASATKQVEH